MFKLPRRREHALHQDQVLSIWKQITEEKSSVFSWKKLLFGGGLAELV